MIIVENKQCPEVGEFIVMPSVSDQLLIAEASLQYLEHPNATAVEQPANMINLMENGVLAFAGPEENEPIYEDENGEQFYEVITDRFVLQKRIRSSLIL